MFPFVIRHFGLAAAITLAQAGRSVQVIEAKETIGGGCRSMELTLPGFIHDVCSTIHPFAIFSPFFRTLPLEQYGLHWVHPDAEIAHPFDNGSAALLYRSVEATGATFDRAADARTYDKLMKPLADSWDSIADSLLGPLAPLRLLKLLRHPFAHLRFGVNAFPSIGGLAEKKFKGKYAPALLAGIAAHSALPLEQPATAAFGLVLGILGHVVGWPFPRGGSRKIADALAAYFSSLGGEMVTGLQVESLNDLPSAHLYMCDLTPRQLLRIAGKRLPSRYQHKLERYRYGQGVCKLDFALAGPIPWKARECMRAATVHVGGTLEEIAASERAVWQGEHPERPFLTPGATQSL